MDKIFFYDLGIRNAIINNFNPLDRRNDVGQLWENFLVVERLKITTYRRETINRFFWRTYTGAELDYVENEVANFTALSLSLPLKPAAHPLPGQKPIPEPVFRELTRPTTLIFCVDVPIQVTQSQKSGLSWRG